MFCLDFAIHNKIKDEIFINNREDNIMIYVNIYQI